MDARLSAKKCTRIVNFKPKVYHFSYLTDTRFALFLEFSWNFAENIMYYKNNLQIGEASDFQLFLMQTQLQEVSMWIFVLFPVTRLRNLVIFGGVAAYEIIYW